MRFTAIKKASKLLIDISKKYKGVFFVVSLELTHKTIIIQLYLHC